MSSSDDPSPAPGTKPELPGVLVEPPWLEERLDEPDLRIVDLRDSDAYLSGHVPGAVHLDLAELGSSAAGCDNVLVSPGEFSDLMAERGISNGNRIVAYDDQWGLAAARLIWALHYYGHSGAAVLNGGWDRWRNEDREAASGEKRPAGGQFAAAPRDQLHADIEWIVKGMEAGERVLLDSRTPAEFEEGHLPGALSWDWFNAVPAGSWNVSRDPGELRAEWRDLGIDPSEEVTVYCRSGMRAAHTWLVLRNAGFPRVRLYDGSWQEWSTKMEKMEDEDGG